MAVSGSWWQLEVGTPVEQRHVEVGGTHRQQRVTWQWRSPQHACKMPDLDGVAVAWQLVTVDGS